MTVEQLTDAERQCGLPKDCEAYRRFAKALRIIDAHAADRAALVAQLEAAQAHDARAMLELEAAESQVAELTRERDEARATNLTWLAKYNAQRGELAGVRDEVTRLTEALATAERYMCTDSKEGLLASRRVRVHLAAQPATAPARGSK